MSCKLSDIKPKKLFIYDSVCYHACGIIISVDDKSVKIKCLGASLRDKPLNCPLDFIEGVIERAINYYIYYRSDTDKFLPFLTVV